MVRFAIGFALGAFVCLQLPDRPDTLSLAIGALLARGLVHRFDMPRLDLLGAVAGMAWVALALLIGSGYRLAEAHIGVDVILQGRIDSLPVTRPDRQTIVVEVLEADAPDGLALAPRRIRLSHYGSTLPFAAGDRWQLAVRLKPIAGARNPGGFDRGRWAVSHGVQAIGYIRDAPAPRRLEVSTRPRLDRLRAHLAEGLAAVPGAGEYQPLVAALTLGIRDDVDTEHWSLLRDTGTAHLLAISGLHIGLVAGAVMLLARRFRGRVRPGHVVVVAMLVSFAYAALAGFTLPTRRAVLMLAVWLVARLRLRQLAGHAGLALAMLAVLLVEPLAMLSPGFWLSFGTVALILWLDATRPPHIGRVRRGLRLHLLLGLLLVPMSAWFFQSAALIGPVANAVAIPFVGVMIVPLALITLGLSALSPSVASHTLALSEWLLRVLIEGLGVLSRMPLSSVSLSVPDAMVLGLCLLGLLLLCTPRVLHLRLLALPLLLPAVAFNLRAAPMDGFEVHVLDVGQGLATLITTRHSTLLYDTGGRVSSRLDQVEAVVLPYLQSIGRRRIDTLVVSHPDLDHAAGVTTVLRQFPDVLIHASQRVGPIPEHATICEAGQYWTVDGVSFSYLYPGRGDGGSDNDRSCVLLVHQGQSRVLLTGDIEAAAEARLVRRAGRLPVTLMTAPHHGSKTSSSAAFVQAFSPRFVVFPASRYNRWGFPDPRVQMRYKSEGTTLYQTGIDGAIRLRLGFEGPLEAPRSQVRTARRVWHGLLEPPWWPGPPGPDCGSSVSNVDRSLHRGVSSQPGNSTC